MRRVVGICAFALLLVCMAAVAHAEATVQPRVLHSALSSTAKVRVPNVVGFRMDRATRTLHNARLRVNEECSGLFGCIIKSRWWVCVQQPRAGRYVARYSVVVIYAERRGEC